MVKLSYSPHGDQDMRKEEGRSRRKLGGKVKIEGEKKKRGRNRAKMK